MSKPNKDCTSKIDSLANPKLSDWKCSLFGSDEIVVNPVKEPNWFWRLTQHLILGHKWRKI